MSILKNMSSNYRVDASKPVSNDEEIYNLIEFSNIELPEDILELIRDQTEIDNGKMQAPKLESGIG